MYGSIEVSILIPVYNQSVVTLAAELSKQAAFLGWLFEIRCYDDASTSKEALEANKVLSSIPALIYKQLPRNIGRSAIRNMLAQDATYPRLLFLDCDAQIPDSSFLNRYGRYAAAADVICGGRIYPPQLPSKEFALHWYYGTYKESQPAEERRKQPTKSFMFNNIFISRHVFQLIKLDENINTYGHEDTKFGYELAQQDIPVLHIDNPVIHIGLDTNEAFLNKTKQGVYNLCKIYRQSKLGSDTKLIRTWRKVKQFYLSTTFEKLYDLVSPVIQRNLLGSKPMLFLLDLYKLRVFSEAMKKQDL